MKFIYTHSHVKQCWLLFHECQSVSLEIRSSCFFPVWLCGGVSWCDLGWVSDTACNKYMHRSLVFADTNEPTSKMKDLRTSSISIYMDSLKILFHLTLSGTKVKAVSIVKLNSEIKHVTIFMMLFCMIFMLMNDYARIWTFMERLPKFYVLFSLSNIQYPKLIISDLYKWCTKVFFPAFFKV